MLGVLSKRFNVHDPLPALTARFGGGRHNDVKFDVSKWPPSPSESEERAISQQRKRFSEICKLKT